MAKHIKLQHSESVVLHAASRIYAAYISSGQVAEGAEHLWMARRIREAINLAVATDDAVVSDDEVESSGF